MPPPKEQYNSKAWTRGSLKRPPSKRHDFGLDFELRKQDGNYYITRVEGLAIQMTDLKVGDRLLKFQEQDASFFTLEEIRSTLEDELRVSFEALHPQLMNESIKVVDNSCTGSNGDRTPSPPVRQDSEPSTNTKRFMSSPKKNTRDTAPKSPTKKKTPPVANPLMSPTRKTASRDVAPRSPTKKMTPPPIAPFSSPASSKSPRKKISNSSSDQYVDPEDDVSVEVSVDMSEITEPSNKFMDGPCLVDESPYPMQQRKRPTTNNTRKKKVSSLTMSTGTYTPPSSPQRTTNAMSFSPTRQSPKANKIRQYPSSPSNARTPTSNKTNKRSPTKTKNAVKVSPPPPPLTTCVSSPKQTCRGGRYTTSGSGQPGPTLDYNLKAWVSGSLTRPPSRRHDFGLDFELVDGVFYVTRSEALCKQLTEVKVGDRLLKFQNQDATPRNFTLKDLRTILKEELRVSFETLHPEIMQESITEIDMDIDIGDVVPLQNMEEHNLNGKDVQVLREGKNGQWLVKVLGGNNGNKKKRILVKSDNLNYELLPNRIQLKN